MFVKIYEIQDGRLVEAIAKELQKAKREIQNPGAVLIAYRSRYGDWATCLQEWRFGE